jgi:hypothetical protein
MKKFLLILIVSVTMLFGCASADKPAASADKPAAKRATLTPAPSVAEKPAPPPACQPDDLEGCTAACNADEGKSCALLGVIYSEGKLVPRDAEQSRKLFEKSCQRADPFGCANLGAFCTDGVGGPVDVARGIKLFEQSCDAGSGLGCVNLGLMYWNGRGVVRDNAKAAALFERACSSGRALGCSALGGVYQVGKGVPQNLALARAFYQKGCEGGDPSGCQRLKELEAGDDDASRFDDSKIPVQRPRCCGAPLVVSIKGKRWLPRSGFVLKSQFRAGKLEFYLSDKTVKPEQGCVEAYPAFDRALLWFAEPGKKRTELQANAPMLFAVNNSNTDQLSLNAPEGRVELTTIDKAHVEGTMNIDYDTDTWAVGKFTAVVCP